MRILPDGSCSLHCCTQNGHTVCERVADWFRRLEAAARAGLHHLPPEQRAALEAILAEAPDTTST